MRVGARDLALLFTGIALAAASCRSVASTSPAAAGAAGSAWSPPDASAGWVVTQDGIECAHPAVVPECAAGWCKIPAGCFVMGSPETEFMRGLYTEPLTAVTLTHAFEIGQYETTQASWLEIASTNPTFPMPDLADCVAPECPVTHVTWFDVLEYANRRSEQHTPPLARCYELEGCHGDLGQNLVCDSVSLTTSTPYDCSGYRLPTEAEWEYAARAGTRTAYYSGDITVTSDGQPEPQLEPIAWYSANAELQTHPVGLKQPNQWLLYDMLGNALEWTSDYPLFQDPPGPLTDPVVWETTGNPEIWRVAKGGRADLWPSALRAASRLYPSRELGSQGLGFRLVRTVP